MEGCEHSCPVCYECYDNNANICYTFDVCHHTICSKCIRDIDGCPLCNNKNMARRIVYFSGNKKRDKTTTIDGLLE